MLHPEHPLLILHVRYGLISKNTNEKFILIFVGPLMILFVSTDLKLLHLDLQLFEFYLKLLHLLAAVAALWLVRLLSRTKNPTVMILIVLVLDLVITSYHYFKSRLLHCSSGQQNCFCHQIFKEHPKGCSTTAVQPDTCHDAPKIIWAFSSFQLTCWHVSEYDYLLQAVTYRWMEGWSVHQTCSFMVGEHKGSPGKARLLQVILEHVTGGLHKICFWGFLATHVQMDEAVLSKNILRKCNNLTKFPSMEMLLYKELVHCIYDNSHFTQFLTWLRMYLLVCGSMSVWIYSMVSLHVCVY